MIGRIESTADIALLTVNSHEQEQLTAALEHYLNGPLKMVQGASNEIYLDAGEINGQHVMVAKSLIGSTGSGASYETVSNILGDLSPQLIIAVGIAWGAKNGDGQEIGDILLSTRLRDAQHHKSTEAGIALRGTIESTNGTLVKTFQAAGQIAEKRVHEGLLISVETLFDDEAHRNKFIAADQNQAIGGEMEGGGLLMALRAVKDRRVDWLIVKAICDWGFKKNSDPQKKEVEQRLAAKNAAELCVAAISNFRLVSTSTPRVGLPAGPKMNAESTNPAFSEPTLLMPPERSIAKTVQAYIEKNSSFTLAEGFPIKHKDWPEKLIFELYKLTEELGSEKHFLYVHESASQSGTLTYLRQNHLLRKGAPLIVLTEKPSTLKDSERRLDNLKTVFETTSVFFIDDFGRKFLYKDHIQSYAPFNLPVYVESLAETSLHGSESALRQLKAWYSSTSAPLMVIKGYGGIGKTTLVKQFLDEVYSKDSETGILFIDSHEIIGELEVISRSRQKIDDIYDFYHAQSINQITDEKRLSKELLSLSVDNGSLVIALDGIDEVIAKLGAKFDAVNFINSISTIYSTNLQKAKIIITCRDYFWDSLQNVVVVEKIDLQPFNKSMAEEYFEKSLKDDGKIDKALSMADELALRRETHLGEVYIPYTLDLIAYLIKRKDAKLREGPVEDSGNGKLLKLEIPNDFLVANICQRDITKLHSLSVDNQVEFFVQLSIAKDGHISIYDVKSIIGELGDLNLQVSDDTIERLKGHPLLVCSQNKLYFRYDFFSDYFKVLYIVKYFSERKIELMNEAFVDVAASYLIFDGEFMRSVTDRLKVDDELMFFGMETIERLRLGLDSAEPRARYKRLRASSAIFCLLLTLVRDSGLGKFDINKCSELLQDFFGKGTEIHGFSLVNVGSSATSKLVFDFRGKVLKECYFERYDFFWECMIDEETRFTDSFFRSLEPRKGVRPNFFERTFDDSCDTNGILHLIEKKKELAASHMAGVKEDLAKLFRLFYSRGNFYPQKQDYIRSKSVNGLYLSTLLKHGVIEEFVDPQKATLRQYRVNKEFFPIQKHIEQGAPCIEFDRVAEMFAK
ncbi:NACHT domain-containing protein [Burkholderia gladioli]|uniref:phosphorylase family protein n=1 Tax=Burkholderia gladioli TaxID=28095 RepID=UPI00264F68C8|nr:NACHT domain-containing protein [Burkholderia gladioli]MDN7599927.1 NACHT domain-containing protein [Burkholderia gladioli]